MTKFNIVLRKKKTMATGHTSGSNPEPSNTGKSRLSAHVAFDGGNGEIPGQAMASSGFGSIRMSDGRDT